MLKRNEKMKLITNKTLMENVNNNNLNNNNTPSSTHNGEDRSSLTVAIPSCHEVAIRAPHTKPYPPGITTLCRRGYDSPSLKTGDVKKEKLVQQRVKELGLWDNKLILEKQLHERLSQNIDEDGLFQAINKCKRKRPLRQRVDNATNEIINTVQPKIVKDDFGNNVAYKVDVIMGLFTHNVQHKMIGHTIIIKGSTPDGRGSKLHKEVTIEFPQNVDVSQIQVQFNAGVFKCEAPFQLRGSLQVLNKSFDSVSSAISEETESVTSRSESLMSPGARSSDTPL